MTTFLKAVALPAGAIVVPRPATISPGTIVEFEGYPADTHGLPALPVLDVPFVVEQDRLVSEAMTWGDDRFHDATIAGIHFPALELHLVLPATVILQPGDRYTVDVTVRRTA